MKEVMFSGFARQVRICHQLMTRSNCWVVLREEGNLFDCISKEHGSAQVYAQQNLRKRSITA
jgi:hypothetical protein